jgi:hypothetical protein
MKAYWTITEDQALADYLKETDDYKRNRLFEDKLYAPLFKLSECVCNKYNKNSEDDNKENINNVLSHLASILHKIDLTRGKPFSYLTRAAINEIWTICNRKYANSQKYVSLDSKVNDNEDKTYADSMEVVEKDYNLFDDEHRLKELLDELTDKKIISKLRSCHKYVEKDLIKKEYDRVIHAINYVKNINVESVKQSNCLYRRIDRHNGIRHYNSKKRIRTVKPDARRYDVICPKCKETRKVSHASFYRYTHYKPKTTCRKCYFECNNKLIKSIPV